MVLRVYRKAPFEIHLGGCSRPYPFLLLSLLSERGLLNWRCKGLTCWLLLYSCDKVVYDKEAADTVAIWNINEIVRESFLGQAPGCGSCSGALVIRRSDVGCLVPSQAPDDASGHLGQRDLASERRDRDSQEVRRVERLQEVLFKQRDNIIKVVGEVCPDVACWVLNAHMKLRISKN